MTDGSMGTRSVAGRPAYVGQPLRRFEDARFLTGRGRYLADLVPPGALHLHIVRSPHAHARVVAVDAATAASAPGVAGAFTAPDLAGVGPIPCTASIPTDGPMRVPHRPALAGARVRYVGEPVACVVAATARAAQDAAEQVVVEYDALPCVVDAAAALEDGAPAVFDDAPGNLAFRYRKGVPTGAAFAAAGVAHIAHVRLVNNRVIVAALEHRGALARFDGETYDLLISGQGVHQIRRDLARMFHVPDERMHVACRDVGGGFGVKNPLYPEYALALWAARRLGRPVAWQSGHGEDFVSTAHGRDNVTEARLAVGADGRFLALDVQTIANLGAGMSNGGPGSSTTAPGNALGSGYDIPAVHMSVRGAFTNTVPVDAYRGAGKPEANYLMERLVDEAARLTGIDRVELRRRNLVRRFPHATAMSTTIDGGRFAANLDPALAAADAAGFAVRRAAARARNDGALRGLGVTCFLETARGAPNEGAEVRFGPDGRVALHLGTQSNGQGHETTFPQIAADRLGLPIELFDFVQADTRQVVNGNGHGGARSLHMGGAALVDAIDLVLTRGRAAAARLMQAGPEEVTFGDGWFRAGDRSVSLPEVARAETLDSYHWTLLDRITFPNGCHVAEVEVDRETGVVRLLRYTAADDYGAVINPLLLVGQVQGGLAQGIGQAMMERTVYDDAGQLLSGSFMDYALPRAADLPDLDVLLLGTPTGANRLGVKGAGQAGAIAAPPAVVAAVLDALAPLGVAHLDMPLTSETVWRAMQ